MSATAKDYVTAITALVLLTVLELYLIVGADLDVTSLMLSIIVIGSIKVWFIVAYFMHMRYEARRVTFLPYVPLPFMAVMFIIFVLTN